MINVISDGKSVPIIVGDVAEMPELQGVGQDNEGHFHLVLNGQHVALSEPASENFRAATHLLLVSVKGDSEVIAARKVRIDKLNEGQDLSWEQRQALAKALSLNGGAPGEFYVDALNEFRRIYPSIAA